MNYDIVAGIVRAVLPAVVAILVKEGWPQESATSFASLLGDAVIAVVMGLMVWWTVHRNRTKTQIAKVADIDGVREITIDPVKTGVPPSSPSIIDKIKIVSR